MKTKKIFSLILSMVMVFSLLQTFPVLSSARTNATGCLEMDWEDYLETRIPTDDMLITYGEHALIDADGDVPLPESERYTVHKIHTSLGNSASFIPELLEERIETSYQSVMNEEIQVTVLSGYEEALEQYRQEGDGNSVTGKFLLRIQRGVDMCDVETIIVVHKKLSLSEAGKAAWTQFLEDETWYNDAEYWKYFSPHRTLVTEENGVPLPEEEQYYTIYSFSTSFTSIELFTEEQMNYRLNWYLNRLSSEGVFISGYEEAYAKLAQMENGGSSTDVYKVLIGDYVAEIPITVTVGTDFAAGNFFWEELMSAMPSDSTQPIYVETAEITADANGALAEPIYVKKLHITLGHSESFTEENLERIISSLFYRYTYQIAPPTIQMVSGVDEALAHYQGIGDKQAITQTFRFIYTHKPRHLPSYNQLFEYGIEAEIVIHKDLSIDESARQTLSDNWKNYLEVSLSRRPGRRTYGEDALIEAENNVPLPEDQRYFVHKIHTKFGRIASFTKENLETLLEESYSATMGSDVDITVTGGFEEAWEKFRVEGDKNSVTNRFTLKIRETFARSDRTTVKYGITEEVEIVIHKDMSLEMYLPLNWDEISDCFKPLKLTCQEAPSFPAALTQAIEDVYYDFIGEKISVRVNEDFEEVLSKYRMLADGKTLHCQCSVTLQRNNNVYSVAFPVIVRKDLSGCTGYVNGACPKCGAQLGDANDDGVVDENDVPLLQQFAAGIITETDFDFNLADVDRDGKITSNDVLVLKRIIAGIHTWE